MTDRIDTAKERVAAILDDWEYQARERDIRDPMRGQILEEAALIRYALNCRDAEIKRLRAAAHLVDQQLGEGGVTESAHMGLAAALNPEGET